MKTKRERRHRMVLFPDLNEVSQEQSLSHCEEESAEQVSAWVRSAVETALTDKQREVVELYFFEGLSQGEIARQLGITQQVVQKRLYGAQREGRMVGGALARLRTVLESAPEAFLPTQNEATWA